METTYRINTQDLNLAFLKSIKNLLPNKEVEITVKTINKSKEIDNLLWLKVLENNPVFDFLQDKDEDIYSISDGSPLKNEK